MPDQLPARAIPASAVPPIEVPDAAAAFGESLPGPEHFPPEILSKLRTYVYLLVDPRSGRPFYVGTGRGDRCFEHVAAAREAEASGSSTGGSDTGASRFPMLGRIREAESDGRSVRIDVLRHGLGAAEAALVEVAVAEALGIETATELPGQRRPAREMGSALAKRAKFKRSHQVVLLRVGPKGADVSYDLARHGWRIGRRWIDPSSPRSPRWAVLVSGELVGAVFRIERWDLAASAAPGTVAGTTERYSFVGQRDDELERRYVGRSVAAHWGSGPQGPVTYVWCGPHWVNTAG